MGSPTRSKLRSPFSRRACAGPKTESDGARMLFWGDCAHHHVASLARPDWHCVFDADKEQGAATRKHIYDMAATERIPVSGYHMPFPSIGYVERRSEGGYRWVPHSFQLTAPKAG